ncbi:Rhodanese-like domain protein [Gemmata sp. SH-PL17]|uniref:rhodanese-like domain-containing protein n=1 Tax=Gemmata sp. SH-PL17 TaxID=1630693 RepID=UPI0004AF4ED7|nr:rhodanese-like domain-containing protein [Gemmata sp. SH-PL17]AMV23037.1 Rhodanese-like domain protein [Gemmata sp. SH-PL17]
MKYLVLALVFVGGYWAANVGAPTANSADSQPPAAQKATAQAPDPLANPNIDFNGYLKIAQEAAQHREKRRLTEAEFLKMSQEKGVILLDARSKEKYDILHIKGAINLSFPDIDIESLKKTLPDKDAKILIYCNNNFVNGGPPTTVRVTRDNPTGKAVGAKAVLAFPSKAPTASLNISTYIALYGYGYKNVYELAPQLDPKGSVFAFESNPK